MEVLENAISKVLGNNILILKEEEDGEDNRVIKAEARRTRAGGT